MYLRLMMLQLIPHNPFVIVKGIFKTRIHIFLFLGISFRIPVVKLTA